MICPICGYDGLNLLHHSDDEECLEFLVEVGIIPVSEFLDRLREKEVLKMDEKIVFDSEHYWIIKRNANGCHVSAHMSWSPEDDDEDKMYNY